MKVYNTKPKQWVHAAYHHTTYCGDYASPAYKTKDMGKVDCPKCVEKLEANVKTLANWLTERKREV